MISPEVNQRADAYRSNPNALQQKYAASQDLLDLLALQQLNKEKQEAERQKALQSGGAPATVADQIKMNAAKMMPMQQGLGAIPAPNMESLPQNEGGVAGYEEPQPQQEAGYAAGGAVGYASGDLVNSSSGKSLDEAKDQAEKAAARLQQYGLRQRMEDPQGYEAAKSDYESARAKLQAAKQSWETSIQRSGMSQPAFYPKQTTLRQEEAAPEAPYPETARTHTLATPVEMPKGIQQALPREMQPRAAQPAAQMQQPQMSQPQMQQPVDELRELQLAQARKLAGVNEEELAAKQAAEFEAVYGKPQRELLASRGEELSGLRKMFEEQKQRQLEATQSQTPDWIDYLQRAAAAKGSGLERLSAGAVSQREAQAARAQKQADIERQYIADYMKMMDAGFTNKQAVVELGKSGYDAQTAARAAARAQQEKGMESIGKVRGQDIQMAELASRKEIAELDRNLRIKLHNTPSATKATVEEQAVQAYIKAGLSPTAAFEKVQQVKSSAPNARADIEAIEKAMKDNRALIDSISTSVTPKMKADAMAENERLKKKLLEIGGASTMAGTPAQQPPDPKTQALIEKYGR